MAAEWFDEYLGKSGYRLFNGVSDSLKRRELKEDPVWGSSVQPDDKVYDRLMISLSCCNQSTIIKMAAC